MSAEPSSAATRLCAACGMCCDGTLFHSVIIQSGDSARGLAALGLKIKRRGGPPHFLQPCRAHRDGQCAIYEQRPTRCRLFNCRQLLRVAAGEIDEAAALGKIRFARRQVAEVNALLLRVAETNPARALAHRCANALTVPEKTPTHRDLEVAMQELELLLEADFRVP